MAAGLQIFDASGNIVLDATHRIARVFGIKQLTGGLNEAVQHDQIRLGCVVSFQADSYIGWLSGGLIHPTFSVDTSTGTLSWTWAAKNSAQYDTYQGGLLVWGAY